MKPIGEAELTDLANNNAIEQFNITESKNGNYQITVKLTWKSEKCRLVTARNKPREWVSLDRLIKHIKEKYNGNIVTINLSLRPLEKEQ